MTVITDVYGEFLVECRGGFEDLCRKIDAGEVPPGVSAKVTIEVSSEIVDRLMASASEGDD